MRRIGRHVAVLGTLLMLGLVPGCGGSKQKIKDFKKYEKDTLPIVNASFAHYRGLTQWLSTYKPELAKTYQQGVEAKLEDFKNLIGKLEKVKPGNSELEKFKENDLKMVHNIKDIYKEFRDQIRAGKAPHKNAKVLQLEQEYKQRNQKYKDMRHSYIKKYQVKTVKVKRRRRRKKKW